MLQISTLLMLLASVANAQSGELSTDLKALSAKSPPEQRISVIIDIPEKLDIDKLRDINKKIKRAQLIVSLKSHAEKTQANILKYLNENAAKKITSLWMVNKISVELQVGNLSEISQISGVGLIKANRVIKSSD